MSTSSPVKILLADEDGQRLDRLESAIQEVRRPTDGIVRLAPLDLPTYAVEQLKYRDPAILFVSARTTEDIDKCLEVRKAGPTPRIFSVALVDPDDHELVEHAYLSGLNACIPMGDLDETAEHVKQTARFALETATL